MHQTEHHTTRASRIEATAQVAPNAYVTDGLRLFRVVSPLRWSDGYVTADMEDCMTLDVRAYTPTELWSMRLRVVRLAHEA